MSEAADAYLEALADRDTKPAYERFIEDSEENLWVARFEHVVQLHDLRR